MSYLTRAIQQSQTTAGLDANSTASVTVGLEISQSDYIIMFVNAASGTHAAHKIEIQVSTDDTTWYSADPARITNILTGVGFVKFATSAFKYARAKVFTTFGRGGKGKNIKYNI